MLAGTPIWRRVYPREIHVYGIGPPKTGTSSIARIFEPAYRSGHEFHLEYTIDLAFDKLRGNASEEEVKRRLLKRDSWRRLECESNALLIYFAPELSDLFPDAKFICTVRTPRDWVRSAIDQHLNVSREDRAEPNARTLRPWLYDVLPCEKYPREEQPLAEEGVWNLKAYFNFWADHYRRALELPEERVLFIQTKNISSSISRIARFIGDNSARLSKSNSHANRTKKYNNLIEKIDNFYIEDMVSSECTEVVKKIEKRIDKCLK
jgi:hypothetical protein